MNVKSLTPVFTRQQIQERVQALAAQVDAHYGNAPLLVVCVLKGACIFFADIVRNLRNPNVSLEFVRLSSYGMSDTASSTVSVGKDIEVSLEGKHVLVVEDILDTGKSMTKLMEYFAAHNPASLRLAVLVDKAERRQVPIYADFVGFHIREGFIVGYGLDYAEQFRQLPDIYAVELVEP